MSSYCVSLHRDPQPFVAIPAFVSRYFRHSSIFVSAQSGIREPKDLVGKRIGTPVVPDDRAGLDTRHTCR
jgi:4,5-dihydroxyphthalate decarboxylase